MKHLFANSSRLALRMASAVVLLATLPNVDALAQRQDQPNLLGVELLGRGLIYSVNYERSLTPRTGIGMGTAYWNIDKAHIAIVPLYASWNPVGDRHSLYLAAGTTLIYGREKSFLFDTPGSESAFLAAGTSSVGYQYRSSGGYVIRPALNILLSRHGNIVWPGITLGRRF
jgi:hypothetical protein